MPGSGQASSHTGVVAQQELGKGLVEVGVIMGTFAAWQMGAAARLFELATSPIRTRT